MVEIILVYHDSLLESLSEFDGGGGVCFEDLIYLTTIKNENCANVWNLWSTIYGSVSIRMYVLISVLKKTRNVSKLLYNKFVINGLKDTLQIRSPRNFQTFKHT